jgi:RHS repeat-associated protein
LDAPDANDTQAWSFDEVGRVTKITENAADRAEWLYDLSGAQTKLTYGSGSYATRLYDVAGRLTSLAHKKGDNSVIQSFAYVLDKVGNRSKLTLNGGDYLEYSYDPLYQLTKENRKTSGGTTQYRNDFYYNYVSNRTKLVSNDGMSDTTTIYSYNSADQLTRDVTGATTTDYTFDASGALTRKSSGGSNHDYLYDARSLITKYDAPGTSNDTTYNWDLASRRVKKDVNGAVNRFLYDHSIGEIIAEYDGSMTPALQASYIPTGLDSNVSMTRGGTVYYFHSDRLESTWNITGASETVQNTYAYQAFGELYGSPTENVTNTRRFTGAEHNSEDESQTHGVRRYNTALGLWNRRDPLLDVDSWFLYAYVTHRPALFRDPRGFAILGSRVRPGEQQGRLSDLLIESGELTVAEADQRRFNTCTVQSALIDCKHLVY